MMNVFFSSHVLVNVNENDDDYNDDVKVMKAYDDDHHSYLLPYLLDEDQHLLAKEQVVFLFIPYYLLLFKPDVTVDELLHNLFDDVAVIVVVVVVVAVQTMIMVMAVERKLVVDALDQMTWI